MYGRMTIDLLGNTIVYLYQWFIIEIELLFERFLS